MVGPAPVTSPRSRRLQVLEAAVFAGLIFYSLVFLCHGVRLVLYPFDADNSEAYLVSQGWRLAQGEGLYPSIQEYPFHADNYPPFYPMLEAVGFWLTGPNFHYPRALSLAAALGCAALLAAWTRSLTASRASALFTALVFLSFYHVYDWCALARVDALGLWLTLSGLLAFRRFQTWWPAALFMLLALFTKQTFFAAPLAVLVALRARPREAGFYLAFLLGMGGILFGLLIWSTGGRAFSHLVTFNHNDYRLSDLWYYARRFGFFSPLGIKATPRTRVFPPIPC